MPNPLARSLRKTMTRQEVLLWSRLRALRPQGVHIRRQAPIERYIVDFLCLRARLVIEIDGNQHGSEEGLAKDALRDARLEKLGFGTLRFSNEEVMRNLNGVAETILHCCLDRQSER